MKLAENVREKIHELGEYRAMHFWQEVTEDIEQNGIESPIEQIFYAQWKYQQAAFHFNHLSLLPQQKIKNYKVDFVVDCFEWFVTSSLNIKENVLEKIFPELPKVVIELDGHAFHEKTPEQVAADKKREREIISEGYTVLRFSGREVVRDAEKCVDEVFALVSPKQREVKIKYLKLGGW